MANRSQIVYRAKLAEQAERYDEMADAMKQVAKMGEELSIEERNLLSVAYKNAVGARRASWRIISSVEHKQRSKGNDSQAEQALEYRKKVEAELNDICEDILKLLAENLINTATTAESKVFYYKMKGDYYRYISEFTVDQQKQQPMTCAQEAYQEATVIANELASTHPIRLGLALNYSVFFYEIMSNPDKACEMAQKAFQQAVDQLDSVSEDSYRDSTLIMQLLRDNLTLWTADNAGEQTAAQQASGTAAAGASGDNAGGNNNNNNSNNNNNKAEGEQANDAAN